MITWWCARRRIGARVLKAVLLTSPLITVPLRAVTSTTVAYFAGTATIARGSRGKPGSESANLHPIYRALVSGGECDPDVSATVVSEIRRGTFIALFNALGPMRGAYTGPYPSRDRALAVVQTSGFEVGVDAWDSGDLRLGDRSIRVSARWRDSLGRGPVRHISATIAGDLAIVLLETPTDQFVSLADLGRFGWFATYRQGRPPR